jgi:hypothetical protein
MLLKNVNLKYPQTRNLNSVIDASREPDIEMQRAFESKVRAVDKPISEDDINKTNNLQDIEKIIDWIGNTKKDCDMYFELSSYVTQIFLDVGITLDRYDNLKNVLTTLSEEGVESFDKIYFDIEDIYTGNYYFPKNQKLNNFKNSPKKQSESFRTFLINFAIDEFNNKINNTTNKDDFYETFRNYFMDKFKINLDKNFKELKKNKLYELSNQEIIDIIDEILPATLGEVILPKLPKKRVMD